MVTLVATYAMVWAALAVYVLRLGARQRRLERALEALHAQPRPPRATIS